MPAGSYVLDLEWVDGTRSRVDVSDLIARFKIFAPLRSGDLFEQADIGEYGWSVRWTDDIDLSSDTLWRLAREQAGETMSAAAFRDWRKRRGLTLDRAAQELGLSRRMVAYYDSGQKPIPRTVMLATRGLDAEDRAA